MNRIAVIGGGGAGLAAALRLRCAGHEVLLFEKNATLGGKIASHRHEGFTFDLGPTVLTMPFVLRDLFRHCGRSLADYVELHRVEPTCRYHWSDGTAFDAWSNGPHLVEEVRRVFPDDAGAVQAFLDHSERLYDATRELFLFNPFDGPREFLKPSNLGILPMLPRLGLARTMYASLRRRFVSPKLVQVMGRFATYNGSSPYRAPATLNVIPHVEIGMGTWYPRGGMGSIAAALARLAEETGVLAHPSTAVERIELRGRRVISLSANAASHDLDALVANTDVLWAYRNLLGPAGIPAPAAVMRGERSCSGFVMLLAVRGVHRGLAHHNIFFSDDYPDEFRDIFERKRLPRAMTIYLSIGSKSDPSLAPEGCENWYILVNAPESGIEHHDAGAHEAYAASILERLKAFGLEPEIQWRGGLMPLEIESRYNSAGGAIYGASSNGLLSMLRRPRNRVPGLENFFFAGGSTHPGGGLPLVLLSGDITARLVSRYLAGESVNKG
ncbi:MAG: phytoene desaturase [Bacteroidetes bacterium]|nr:phytoene desaturase [Bacteroidota bacterium]